MVVIHLKLGHILLRARHFLLIFAALALVFVHVSDAEAKKKARKTSKSLVRQKVVRTPASGTASPRYAAVILNPATGEIYHQDSANERRYPASLTKMMTLYLLFEALENNKIDLDDRMPVSELAARQPQTNLSLDAGDRINVETAIKSLVVRSANDVSVVVAEKLAGDVGSFAQKMTAKAKQLGMRNTVFKNPNGLPNSAQYTSAMDMAKLGIALKRDFPRYYRYFSTLQFSHNGVTYYTHNRVMLRYAGVDGIKTGYIGSSGFNLVTSVVRGGRPLVGVVMGGQSGGWRDNRMIELLDESYDIVARRGAVRGKRYPNNLPLPKKGGAKGAGIYDASEEMDVGVKAQPQPQPPPQATAPAPAASIPEPTEAEDGGIEHEPVDLGAPAPTSPFEAVKQPSAPAAYSAPASSSKVIELSKPAVPAPAAPATPFDLANPPETMVVERPAVAAPAPKPAPAPEVTSKKPSPTAPSKPATAASSAAPAEDTDWGVQVGAFSSHELAMQAARNAAQLAPKALGGANIGIVGPAMSGVPVHRARFERLSQTQARKACEALINNNSPCFIFKMAQ